MLAKLSVRNFAIIDKTDIILTDGFNTITGETGAGKSILLGALSLILGQRANTSDILDQSKKSVIEGLIILPNQNFKAFFKHNDLDFDNEIILRREINTNGKSRAFINDTPVTLDILKEFASQVIDLHQQHQSQSIAKPDFQREVVDLYAHVTEKVVTYHKLFIQYQKNGKLLADKKQQQIQNLQQQDYLQFQFDELEQANLQTGEVDKLEKEFHAILHFEELQSGLSTINELLTTDDSGAISTLKNILSELRKLSIHHESMKELEERMRSAFLEIEDISNEVSRFEVSQAIDEQRQVEIEDRLNHLNKLLNKHQLHSDDELIEKKTKIQEQLSGFHSISDDIEKLQKEVTNQKKELYALAEEISLERKAVISALEKQMKTLLHDVGMPKAEIKIEITKAENLQAYGMDAIRFLFSANTGSQPKLLQQIASGGELSRLMLIIKSIIADKAILPTMIFDEIDTGISGEVAIKVGNLLQKLANNHQIISITHLPQIAAKGSHHIKVYKEEISGHTRSKVKSLNAPDRILEIAEMLGGANPSSTSIEAAKELLEM